MQNAPIVRVLDRVRHGPHEDGGPARLSQSRIHQPFQALTLDQLHREVMLTIDFADFVNRDDLQVIKLRRRQLRLKPFHVASVAQGPEHDHFKATSRFKTLLPCAINDALAPSGDFGQQFVISERTRRRIARAMLTGGRFSRRQRFRQVAARRVLGAIQPAFQEACRTKTAVNVRQQFSPALFAMCPAWNRQPSCELLSTQ